MLGGDFQVATITSIGASVMYPASGGVMNEFASALVGSPVHGDAVILSGERGQHLYQCLRPELVRKSPTPLSSDAFTFFGRHGCAVHNDEVSVLRFGL